MSFLYRVQVHGIMYGFCLSCLSYMQVGGNLRCVLVCWNGVANAHASCTRDEHSCYSRTFDVRLLCGQLENL